LSDERGKMIGSIYNAGYYLPLTIIFKGLRQKCRRKPLEIKLVANRPKAIYFLKS